jgi:hypothetical protein
MRQLYRNAAAIALVTAVAGMSAPAVAQTADQYTPWQSPREQALLDELRRMVARAERDRAASPDFLGDLDRLIERYSSDRAAATAPPPPAPEAPSSEVSTAKPPAPAAGGPVPPVAGEPPAQVAAPARPLEEPPITIGDTVVGDDFSDGNFTAAPGWTVVQGDWSVDPDKGLRSAAADGGNGTVTAIALTERMPNAFALDMELTDIAASGQFEVRFYQGNGRESGYRLVYRADGRPALALYRAGASGIVQLAQTASLPALTRGERADISWVRRSDGTFFVTVAGQPVLRAADTAFRDGWTGLMLVDFEGDFAVRSLAVAAVSG